MDKYKNLLYWFVLVPCSRNLSPSHNSRVRASNMLHPKNGRPGGGGVSAGYGAPVGGSKVGNGITRPFHDFDSSSEDGELVRKPYTDEP